MGYKPDQGIGASGAGRTAPVEVDLKTARTGLGIDEAKRRQRDAVKAQQADRGTPSLTSMPSPTLACRELAQCRRHGCRLTAQTHAADTKRVRLHEETHAAFLQSQAATFSTRQAESNVFKARKVRTSMPLAAPVTKPLSRT